MPFTHDVFVYRLNHSQLNLNSNKIEILWLGGDNSRLGHHLPTLDGVPLKLASTVKTLAMVLDSLLLIEAQITNIAKQAFLGTSPELATETHAMVTS